MPAHHLLVQRHRPQPRARLQQRHDLLREDPRQRIRAPPPPPLPFLRRPPGIRFDPVRRRRAEPRLRPGQRGTVLLPVRHVELHLVVRDVSARHLASLRSKGKHQTSGRPRPPPALSPCLSLASHPDCRATLLQTFCPYDPATLNEVMTPGGVREIIHARLDRQRIQVESSPPRVPLGIKVEHDTMRARTRAIEHKPSWLALAKHYEHSTTVGEALRHISRGFNQVRDTPVPPR